MLTIDQDFYQFSTYIPPIDLSFHQYLLITQEPLLVHTGNVQQANALIPQLKAALKDKLREKQRDRYVVSDHGN